MEGEDGGVREVGEDLVEEQGGEVFEGGDIGWWGRGVVGVGEGGGAKRVSTGFVGGREGRGGGGYQIPQL